MQGGSSPFQEESVEAVPLEDEPHIEEERSRTSLRISTSLRAAQANNEWFERKTGMGMNGGMLMRIVSSLKW